MNSKSSEIFLAAAVIGASLLLVLFPAVAAGDGTNIPAPYLRSVDPMFAKPGDTPVAKGEWIGKAQVAELFLTDGKTDLRMEVVKQTDKEITFRVPLGTPAARYRLAILTVGAEPKLLEQPVFLSVTQIADPLPTIPTLPSIR